MSLRNKSLLAYIAKCVAGILLCSLVSYFFKWIDYPWSLISVVLGVVAGGQGHVGAYFSTDQSQSGGCLVPELCFCFRNCLIPTISLWGAILSLFICDRLKLNAGARSTLAAMIIILLHNEGTTIWDTALSRVSAVVIGCFLGLGITYAFHSVIKE